MNSQSPRLPSRSNEQHDDAPAQADENGLESWLIKDNEGREVTDRFGKSLNDHDEKLYEVYQSFRGEHRYTLRSAVAIFIIENGAHSGRENLTGQVTSIDP